jgi:colanic acid/amylovoran biosynthesis glycosyltransferase
MAELKAQAERLGLGSSVTFPGFLPQVGVKKLIYQSHLFLHPSRTSADGNREGIPNAALEAMASGMPVIATTHGGFPEAIESGISGLLVEENRADLLAQAALQVIENNALLERLIEGGRRAVETKFDRAAQVKTLEGYYQTLIDEKPQS